MSKQAGNRYPIHDLLLQRWSPRAFSNRSVDPEKLGALFEAARWAASCFNEQPWRFMLVTRDQGTEYDKLLACLVDANQVWAKQAPVLVLGLAKQTFTRNGNPNAYARHDLGLATAQLMTQATALDLYVHAMAGILPDKARDSYGIPEDYDVVTALAIGYLGAVESLPEQLQETERAPRDRRPLADLVFTGVWGKATLLGDEQGSV
jgi:nitroreductase